MQLRASRNWFLSTEKQAEQETNVAPFTVNLIGGNTMNDGIIAVTGATGQQGSKVAKRLLAQGWKVRALT
jgi:phosphoglycerate dehydrogenase-like enzyme